MTRAECLALALKEVGADGAIISSEINQRYLSGFDYSDGYILITPSESFLITDSRYIEAAKNQVTDMNVVLYKDSMLSTLETLARERGCARLLVEEDELCLQAFEKIKEKIPFAEISAGASAILKEMRKVKSACELSLIAEAQRLTDAAFTHILDYISPRRTEKEIALELEFFMRKNGAEATAFDTIAVSGAASSLPHGVPSDIPLRCGFLTMDFGAKVDGYCSDMTRTVVIGKADEEMKRVYDTVLSAQLAALDFIRGGISCRDADEAARSIIREAGYGSFFGHSLGHGVGLYIHESPSLSPKADLSSLLQAGNVVTVEPGIYLEGRFGCRIEDMVAINPDGSLLNFTQSTKDLIEIS